jgi:hypothetical protein
MEGRKNIGRRRERRIWEEGRKEELRQKKGRENRYRKKERRNNMGRRREGLHRNGLPATHFFVINQYPALRSPT